MSLVEQLPILYGLEKNGKTKTWTAFIYTDGTKAWADIQYGQLDGKKQTTRREYLEGKNIGKKNETSPLQQCLNETKKKWQDKKEKDSYITELTNAGINGDTNDDELMDDLGTAGGSKVFPMLAHKYEPHTTKKKKNDIEFPCYVQPKLDGLRCIVYVLNGDIVFQSRTGSYFETMDHLKLQLLELFKKYPQLVLDGELYTTDYPFEELAGLIKKKKISADDKEKLQSVSYHIYDVVNDKTYVDRYGFIYRTIPKLKMPNLLALETVFCDDMDTFKSQFSKWVAEGYEGIMMRNTHGLYRTNYRSHDLQKYKEFLEDEYPIVGFKEADGRDKGTVIWICRTPEGREFNVRPRGTMELRREWYENGSKYIGKKLTVIYQELSEMNVPRFPVGKAIRDGY